MYAPVSKQDLEIDQTNILFFIVTTNTIDKMSYYYSHSIVTMGIRIQ